MILLIDAELTNPPSTKSSFRDITLYCSIKYQIDVLLECKKEEIDIYYHWLKPSYIDYIKDIVEIGKEKGIRLTNKQSLYKPSLIVDKLIPENSWNILKRISYNI
jgi:hypothetical protein